MFLPKKYGTIEKQRNFNRSKNYKTFGANQ